MKRSIIESRIREFPKLLKEKIEQAPVPYFVLALALGVFLVAFYRLVFWIGVIAILGVTGLWFFSEADDVTYRADVNGQNDPNRSSPSDNQN